MKSLCAACRGVRTSAATLAQGRVLHGQHGSSSRVKHGLSKQYSTGVTSSRIRPPFVAIIGSGPAGFYTAQRLLKMEPNTKIDMYEGLPAPFGLSRYGVAPDHPEVKECEKTFAELMAAHSSALRFYGNLSVGHRGVDGGFQGCTVPLLSLARSYDAIVFAYGSSRDRLLGIPGEPPAASEASVRSCARQLGDILHGIYSAREFVAWYNSHPSFFPVSATACSNGNSSLFPELADAEEVTIIGQGNVALDVARILLAPLSALRRTDISDAALDALARSRGRLRRVHIVGRRGPMQVAFTRKELRELQALEAQAGVRFESRCDFFPTELLPDHPRDRVSQRLVATLKSLRATPVDPVAAESTQKWSLDFLLSPVRFYGAGERVEGTEFVVNDLSDPFAADAKAVPTDQTVKIPSQIVFRSIGYKSVPLEGFSDLGISFDTRKGCIFNDGLGRVMRKDGDETHDNNKALARSLPGLYCAGWAKNGPTGKIVNTLTDADITATGLLNDWNSGTRFLRDDDGREPRGMDSLRHDIQPNANSVVSWEEWQRIDTRERKNGAEHGRPRIKMALHDELMRWAKTPLKT